MSVRLPFLDTSVVIPSSAASSGDEQQRFERLSRCLDTAAGWPSLSANSGCSVKSVIAFWFCQ